MNPYCVITMACENEEEADKIIDKLIEQRLISCAQKTNMTSTYRWKEKIEKAQEVLVQMKSKQVLYPEIEKVIVQLHSYEVPEIFVSQIQQGYLPYLNWIEKETK